MKVKLLLMCAAAVFVSVSGFGGDSTETRAMERAVELYPDANTLGSPLNIALERRAAEIRKSTPRYFENPNWPILLTAEVASSLGIVPAVSQSAAGSQPNSAQQVTIYHVRFADRRVEQIYLDTARDIEASGEKLTNEKIYARMAKEVEELKQRDSLNGRLFLLNRAIGELQAQMRR